MAKLTLSIDEDVIERAKTFAEKRGTSVSKLVEGYLNRLSRPAEPGDLPPVLRRLRGVLAGEEPGAYRRHLERKYR